MRWNGFVPCLGAAAAGAAGALAVWHVGGHGPGAGVFAVAFASIFAFGLAPGHGVDRRTRGLLAAAAVAGAGWAGLVVGAPFGALAATLALGWARVRWLYPGRGARAVWLELALAAGALAMADFLWRSLGGGGTGLAAAVWGYGLVQGLFFVLPGCGTGPRVEQRDGFERARRRLQQLLDEVG
jgi:hypothetical protein